MSSVVGLVTRLVGVFDERRKQRAVALLAGVAAAGGDGEGGGESGGGGGGASRGNDGGDPTQQIQRREISSRGSGVRRAKIDAALAFAASRTRQRQRANAGVEGGHFIEDHGLQRSEMKALENIFKTYDGSSSSREKGGGQVDMKEFAAAMSNPKIAHLIRRVVEEGSSREKADAHHRALLGPAGATALGQEKEAKLAAAAAAENTHRPEDPSLNNLSVESLFDGDTIRHAAAVTLQALTRRIQTQRKLDEGVL
jgi:hypothetical protein